MEDAHLGHTLLLSQAYEPVKVISWQRALTLFSLGKVEVLEEYDGFVRSSTVVLKIPSVVRLLRAFKRFRKPVRFSRVNIYARDGYACQYCGKKQSMSKLTYDHVLPRSQGGTTCWTNITTCCVRCNLKKGGRTPQQANMRLLSKPMQPAWVPAAVITVSQTSVPDAWREYLYWTSQLDET
jgi:5-methylcytosine-specific restriction endonuclease McrA